mmetsp:Transcript_31903/g.90616  ORF Transcript_31903/g.90616 Transcript_31903/m.90616 type:complete len:216 (+) Transcript_31903:2245-2892(+)
MASISFFSTSFSCTSCIITTSSPFRCSCASRMSTTCRSCTTIAASSAALRFSRSLESSWTAAFISQASLSARALASESCFRRLRTSSSLWCGSSAAALASFAANGSSAVSAHANCPSSLSSSASSSFSSSASHSFFSFPASSASLPPFSCPNAPPSTIITAATPTPIPSSAETPPPAGATGSSSSSSGCSLAGATWVGTGSLGFLAATAATPIPL